MLIGYARTSTLDQKASVEAQRSALLELGCEKVFAEQVSSVDLKERAALAEALEFVREGDTLVVTKLDRLARSVQHLLDILSDLDKRGAHLRIVGLGIDTWTPTGKLLLTMLGGEQNQNQQFLVQFRFV